MSNITELGSLHGRLCGELAAALARRVTKSGHVGESFYHDSDTAHEETVGALTKFGLLSPVPRDDMPGETWFCFHALTMDANDMPDALARTVSDNDARLPELLTAYLLIFGHYDALPDHRDFFLPPDYLAPSVKMLARAGFADRSEDQFRWTDQIGTAMQAASLWDEDGASFEEGREHDLEESAHLAWATMPETLKRAVLSGNIGFMTFVKTLALSWRGKEWRPYKLDDPFELQGEIQLAQRILEIAAQDSIA